MKKRLKSILVASMLTVSLCGNVLVVNAQELNGGSVPEEVSTIEEADIATAGDAIELELDSNVEAIDSGVQSAAKGMSEQFQIGTEFNIDLMAMAAAENTDPNNARAISVNSITDDDAITEAGQERWYAFSADAGKLTLDLDFTNSTNVDYDLYLYKYDEATGYINLVDGMETGSYIEHFSTMVEAGIYFVWVNGYAGYDAVNPYTLGVVLSTYYDAQEVDDRLNDAYVFSGIDYSVTGTIDNQFDVDIQKYVVSNTGRLSISLTNNGSKTNLYAADILDSNGNKLGSINQNQNYYADLTNGTYYFKVYCSTFGGDYNSTYTLRGDTRTQAAGAKVTHAGDAQNPIVDYVGGPYWRVSDQSYVTGYAYDSRGYRLPNADVTIAVQVNLNNAIKIVSGRTDSQGNFNIRLNLGPAVGVYSYYNTSTIHYYDIVPVLFLSNGVTISSDVDYFYHFAYAVRP